jgi:hypothetical protein
VTPITEGVRCVVNNESLLDTMHIILIINLVMANTHPKITVNKEVGGWFVREKNGKSEEIKTPCQKRLKVVPVGVGIVTCSQPIVMSKFHHSNESKTSFLLSMRDDVSSVTKRLVFTGKHQVQCSHNSNQMK